VVRKTQHGAEAVPKKKTRTGKFAGPETTRQNLPKHQAKASQGSPMPLRGKKGARITYLKMPTDQAKEGKIKKRKIVASEKKTEEKLQKNVDQKRDFPKKRIPW